MPFFFFNILFQISIYEKKEEDDDDDDGNVKILIFFSNIFEINKMK
jgi:hypothetical protein